MPFISEAASAIKSRFGFHNPSDSVRATPDVSTKSSFRENLSQYSAIRSISDRDDSRDGNNNSGSEMVVRSFEMIEEPSFWKDHNVQVIIRLRPLSSSEISQQGYSRCVKQESHQTVTWTGHPETRFTFDLVADETVSQEKLFSVAGVPMVENCVSGYNSCIFAYGQTGSGKTHTMLGDIEGGTRRHSVNCGMTPRVFEHLFTRIQKEREARREEKLRFTCKCSFLEIYNEQILDLLNPSSCNLQIREDLKKGVYVENLTEIEVSNAREVMQQLLQGAVNRKVAATNMNHASSRSHSVFTCAIECSWESQGVTHHRFARLNLVDLAGSERQKSSGAEGERLKEATNINKSLSTLGLVIMNLVSISNGKSLHVPYRDSKLTFLLQDSLGGNSKTMIIANISPANSCSLETLSTLKFAQRAKFIKNNAIVNEDASGDVLAMRMQIQQLKKEVSHLRGLVGGGASVQDGDTLSVGGLLGSPGTFKWEGFNVGAFSPLTSDKRASQKKEYEAALVGAFRREKDKDLALQALSAENQAVMQLAKQRENEIKGLTMRLRFRESGIKRLEAVASGKISAETHLLQEKEELLKEIEVLRSQVDRNQEVTRFAMENLRLKEEIRRLKSFCEEGEKERMNNQIMILQNKLLEALDWKLMNESNCTTAKNSSPTDHTNSKEKAPTVQFAVNEENEFLRLQAIHNQAEMDLVRKKLNSCLDEKQKLERHVKDLQTEIEVVKSSQSSKEENLVPQLNLVSETQKDSVSFADQMELKAMVDAIAAASQREAEAHEMAITLSRENDELRSRVKVLIEDNNKLIDLYERAVTEINHKTNGASVEEGDGTVVDDKDINAEKVQDLEHQLMELHEENDKLMDLYEKAMQEKNKNNCASAEECEARVQDDCTLIDEKDIHAKKVQDLEHQLMELHEENERLMGLYEKAMQERNAAMVIDLHEQTVTEASNNSSARVPGGDANTPDATSDTMSGEKDAVMTKIQDMEHQLVEMHEENERLMNLYEKAMQERDEFKKVLSSKEVDQARNAETEIVEMEIDESSAVLIKLDEVHDKLSNSTQCATEFGLLEKSILEVDEIVKESEGTSKEVHENQHNLESLEVRALEIQERRAVIDKKLSALKFSLSNFCSSTAYFDERELKGRSRVDSSTSHLNQKKEELSCLEIQKGDVEAAQRKIEEAEINIRSDLAIMESKFKEENKKQESEKVLFAIDNVDRDENHPTNITWKLGTKASELLKSEEEKTKLQNEIKQCNIKLGMTIKEADNLKRKFQKVETEIQRVSIELQKASQTKEKMEIALNNVINEKQILLELRENGKLQIDEMIMEYHQCVFESHLNDEERKTVEADMSLLLTKLERLQAEKEAILKRMTQRLNEGLSPSCLLSEKMKEELQEISKSILEAEELLRKSY